MEVEEIKGVGFLNKNFHVDGKCLEKKEKKTRCFFCNRNAINYTCGRSLDK